MECLLLLNDYAVMYKDKYSKPLCRIVGSEQLYKWMKMTGWSLFTKNQCYSIAILMLNSGDKIDHSNNEVKHQQWTSELSKLKFCCYRSYYLSKFPWCWLLNGFLLGDSFYGKTGLICFLSFCCDVYMYKCDLIQFFNVLSESRLSNVICIRFGKRFWFQILKPNNLVWENWFCFWTNHKGWSCTSGLNSSTEQI